MKLKIIIIKINTIDNNIKNNLNNNEKNNSVIRIRISKIIKLINNDKENYKRFK